MTHRVWIGAAAGVGLYIVAGLLVFAIPHPAAKVAGAAMLFPGPMYGVVAVAGGAVTAGWGHSTDLQRQTVSGARRRARGFCDPEDPPWYCY